MKGWPERHVLRFETPTGAFASGRWTVSGAGPDTWLSAFVSFHKAHHAGLNFSTAWGRLLQAMWLVRGRDRAVSALVGCCALTHEAYATHGALLRIAGRSGAPTAAEILARYPAYRAHSATALRVRPRGRAGRLWRAVAAEYALLGCTQADVLDAVLQPLHRVRARDYPDSRLKAIGEGFWSDFEPAARRAFGRDGWAAVSAAGLRTTLDPEQQRRLDALCSAYVVDRFRAMGCPTVDTAAVLAALPGLADRLGQLTGERVTVDRDPGTLFDLETLRLRQPPRGEVGDLAAGADPLLVVRRAGVLRRQYDLVADPLPDDSAPVCVLRARAGDAVRLQPVTSPGAVPRVRLASVALTCARDPAWRAGWADALDRAEHVSVLVDTPFGESLDALLRGASGFRYAVEPLLDGTGLWAYVCVVDGFPPWVLPCTMTRASALRLRTRSRTGGQEPEEELPGLGALLETARRIVAEESIIGPEI